MENIISSFSAISILVRRVSSFTFISFIISFHILAQDNQIRFDHIGIENGLSQASVFSIVQDSTGFMWFATQDGLNKYDGYSFTIYRPDPTDSNSISDLGIRKLFVDKNGNIWIITLSSMLDRYIPEHDNFIHYNFLSDSTSKPNTAKIISITESRKGTLWVGSVKGELYRYDEISDTFIFQRKKSMVGNQVFKNFHLQILFADSKNIIWMGTWNGLYKYDLSSGNIEKFMSNPNDKNSIGGNIIFSISEDQSANIWFATANGGVSRYNRYHNNFTVFKNNPYNPNSLSSDRVISIYADSKSNIWVGTINKGLNLLKPNSNSFNHYFNNPSLNTSLSGGAVMSIFEDKAGALWFGTSSGGVNRYDQSTQHFLHIAHDLNNKFSISSNTILAIYEDRYGALWVGTDGGGLNFREPGSNLFKHFLEHPKGYGSNSITAIYEDNTGNIWIGTDPGVNTNKGGIYNYNWKTKTLVPFKDVQPDYGGVTVFYQDSESKIWIGTSTVGVYRYDPVNKTITAFKYDKNNPNSISGNSVFAIYEDNLGDIWFGTLTKGLNRFNRKTEKFKVYLNELTEENSISSNSVWCINKDNEDNLWFGTWGGGLNEFNRTDDSFTRITMNNGLLSNVIYGILPDSADNLWLSTSHGLSKINIHSFKIKNFDNSNGLQNIEFNQGAFCKGKDGSFYFGGTKGITVFHPENIKENPNPPAVVLTNFKVFDKPLKMSAPVNSIEQITLSYQQNFFSFEFAALDFTAPVKNQYAYKLEGVDKDWVYSSNRRFASYTDIAPGKYLFRVKGSNNDGVWSKKDAVVSIIITPPFWLTRWFKAIGVLLILAVLYAIHKYRVNKLLAVERTRIRIARDLHDEVSATITGIVYFSDAVSKEVGSEKTPMLSKLLTLIKESASEVQESMSDIIWSINPENDRWETILPRFRRYASDLCESKNIKYKISIPTAIPGKNLSMEKRHNFWLIFKEMVTNAVKHSGCSEMTIAITSDNKQLILNIKDNGKGFDSEKPTDRNGVKNIKSRSAALGGKVELFTAPGKGTEWNLVIQL